jgi:catechol 2,3-dioxygenase-like lactoylglutathione lyase family enzyme
MTHRITATAFVLAVQNLERSADFYARVLGFERLQVDAPGWCFMQRDACRIHLGECPDAVPAAATGDHSYFGYFYVDEAAALHERAKREHVEILKPLTDEPWGMREFALRTPDGHRIMIGERLDD